MKKFYVVSYDVSDDRKRYRVDKELKNKGIRVQKSVFECELTESDFLKLKYKLDKIIDLETDSVRYYYLCKHCIEAIETTGNCPNFEKKDFIIS
ncbi:MAG: CRISPR-associated protein Cas2 [Deferribacteres bacterium]|jgi:CRISPR-associated protein Cas2|nr:CRISPR-associated protein Cas2 [Deferribacteraceae bacterium]MDK2792939.1 CRISPR-associated protein Cas2 [Deferribacteres bacterium]